MNTWQSKNRCKEQILNDNINLPKNTTQPYYDNKDEDSVIEYKLHNKNHYEATINGLRVQTNYLVSMQAINNENQDKNGTPEMVSVTTKSCK